MTEVAAVRQYSAEQAPDSGLLPPPRTLADACLVTTLNWPEPAGIDLARWPALVACRERMLARPAVRRAVREEMAPRAV